MHTSLIYIFALVYSFSYCIHPQAGFLEIIEPIHISVLQIVS